MYLVSELKAFLFVQYCLVCCFLAIHACYFSQEYANIRDSVGLKQGHWIYYGKDRPEAGIPSDGKVEEGFYLNDFKEGPWIKYHNDGITPKIKLIYVNNRPKGCYQKFYETGTLKESGCFCSNVERCENDTIYRYNRNGLLDSKTFRNDAVYILKRGGRHDFPLDVVVCYQEPKINQTDINGKKQGHWIYYGKDRPETSIPSDAKVEEGNYIDGNKEGVWIKYEKDGITPKIKGEYHMNRPVGNYTKGQNMGSYRSFTLKKNHLIDSVIRLHPNGKVEYAAFYDSIGKEQGIVNYFYANGQLEFTYVAMDGIPIGEAFRYFEDGQVKEKILFDKDGGVVQSEIFNQLGVRSNKSEKRPPSIVGIPNTNGIKWQLNSYNKVYNSDNEIWQDGIFTEGQLWDGKVYVYDRDGILLKVEIYKQGMYHSDGQL